MKKRKSRNRTKHLYKEQDKSWKTALFFALFTLAFIAFFASRQRYLMGQTLGCADPYTVCPTSTSTPIPSGGGGNVTTTTTVAPNTITTPGTTTTVVPSQGTTIETSPNTTPDTVNSSPFIPAPSNETLNNANPELDGTPAITNPSGLNSLRSFIEDPGSSEVVQNLIMAPLQVSYGNIMDSINSQLSSLVHQEGPRINRFQLPPQVCTFLGNVGMEWLCQ